MRKSTFLHIALAGYLWLTAWVPLGNWNYQSTPTLGEALFAGKGIEPGDIGLLLFVALPAVLYWIAYRKRNCWFGLAALLLDLFWLFMQIQSWWVPYISGTNEQWQLEYAKGPTTKVLPSFGRHVAPDGMHLVISLLLIMALLTGVPPVYRLMFKRRHP